jgi:hypothetical protein
MSNDFYDISAKMKELFPSNPQGDLAALQQMANAPAEAAPAVDYVNESATVKKGSMPLDMDLSSFTRLAGINESQATGPSGQLKAKDAINTQPAGTTGNPTQDRLVGEESWKDLMGKAKPVEMPDLGPGSTSAQIEDLADRISRIEEWIAGRIDGTMRKVEGKSPHKKGTPKYKKHMAAMHAEESTQKSSIKEELFRKLAASRK